MFNSVVKHPIITILVLVALNLMGLAVLCLVLPRSSGFSEGFESSPSYRPARYSSERPLEKDKSELEAALKNQAASSTVTLLELAADHCLADGEYANAICYYLRSFEMRDSLKMPVDDDLARSYVGVANAYDQLKQFDHAETFFRKAIDVWSKRSGPDSARISATLVQLASLYDENEKDELAEEALRKALALAEKKHRSGQKTLFETMSSLAEHLRREGKFVEAESVLHKALAKAEKEMGQKSTGVAVLLCDLGYAYQEEGKYKEAEAVYGRAYNLLKEQLIIDQGQLLSALNGYLLSLQKSGQEKQCQQVLTDVLKLFQDKYGSKGEEICQAVSALSAESSSLSDKKQGELLAHKYLDLCQETYGDDSREFLLAKGELAGKLGDTDPNNGAVLFNEAIKIAADKLPDDCQLLCELYKGLAKLLSDDEDYAAAEAAFSKASEYCAADQYGDQYYIQYLRAYNYKNWEKYQEAAAAYERSIKLAEKAFGNSSSDLSESLTELAGIYRLHLKSPQKAEPLLKRAIAINEKDFAAGYSLDAGEQLADCLDTLGKKEEAVAMRKRIVASYKTALDRDRRRSVLSKLTVANDLVSYACALLDAGEKVAAEAAFREAIAIFHQDPKTESKDLLYCKVGLARCLAAQDKFKESAELFKETTDFLDEAVYIREDDALDALRIYASDLRKLGQVPQAKSLEKKIADRMRRDSA